MSLDSNQIESLSGIENLRELQYVLLQDNRIRDLSPLAGLTDLGDVRIGDGETLAYEQLISLGGTPFFRVLLQK